MVNAQAILNKRPMVPNMPPVPRLTLDVSIKAVSMSLRATRDLTVHWTIVSVFLSYLRQDGRVGIGLHVAIQTLAATAKSHRKRFNRLLLPPIVIAGGLHESTKEPVWMATINLGDFTGRLEPAILHQMLSLYHDLVRDVAKGLGDSIYTIRSELEPAGPNKVASIKLDNESTPSGLGLRSAIGRIVDLRLRVASIRLELKADDRHSSVLFEADAISGHASNVDDKNDNLKWGVSAEGLGVSLGHFLGLEGPAAQRSFGDQRFAYAHLDLDIFEDMVSDGTGTQLHVRLDRPHAMLDVYALSELSSLLRSWSEGYHEIRTEKAAVIAEVKEDTRRVIDQIPLDRLPASSTSWLATRIIQIEISSLGAAIPLVKTGSDLRRHSRDQMQAILFSIRKVLANNKRNETAQIEVDQIALQLVNK